MQSVIPAQAGIHAITKLLQYWIPACAGMTSAVTLQD